LTIVVGSSAGGSYDLTARMVGRYISRYLPGNPTVVVNNMPGAGGVLAANYIYNVAPKDGSTILLMAREMPTLPLLYGEESKARFDGTKFGWIGSVVKEMGMGVVSTSAPATTLEGLKTHEATMGSSGVETDPSMFARVVNYLIGTKFKVIVGYPGQADEFTAVEKGELDGLFLSGWSGSGRAYVKDKVAQGKMAIFVQMGVEKDPDYPNIPTIIELIKDPVDRAAMQFFLGRLVLGEPFVGPPGMPQDRLALLRSAFQKAMEDHEFQAEMEQQRSALSPIYGEEAQKIIDGLLGAAPDTVARARKLVRIGL
jgi:tripartite-type tricarboxylate transporter receptor subunit TctC